MKAPFIHTLITAITIALIGLIGIQVYWVDNAVELKQDEFAQDVTTVLEDVSHSLEVYETVQKLRENRQGHTLFRSIDTLIQRARSGIDSASAPYFYVKDIRQVDNAVEVKVIEEKDGKRRTKIFRTDPGLTDSLQEIEIGFGDRDLMAAARVDMQGDEGWQNRIEHKANMVSEVVRSLVHVSVFDDIRDRLDTNVLDSMLKGALANHGIKARCVYAVYGVDGEPVFSESQKHQTALRQSPLRVRLYPNDFVDDPTYLSIYFPHQKSYLLGSLGGMLAVSVLLVLAIVGVFWFSISTIIKQKKLSEIKNDFINNMTHELKTPISTISLACQALSDSDINLDENLRTRYVGMIGEENQRLGTLVERVLQSAVWDKGQFKLKIESIDINDLIHKVLDRVDIRIRERGGNLTLKLDAAQAVVQGDRVHLTNVVFNLLDNAIKYSPEAPEIVVGTTVHNGAAGNVSVWVKDAGIGIAREDLKKVFDKLYRVPTGNVHDVKGFGLGLNYVKLIVEKHDGTVSAKSTPGKGSTFTVTIPKEIKTQ